MDRTVSLLQFVLCCCLCAIVYTFDDEGLYLNAVEFPRERNLFSLIRDIAVIKPDEVMAALEEFADAVHSYDIAERIVITIGNDTYNFTETDCPTCTTIISIFKEGDYETLETAVIDLCLSLCDAAGIRGDPLCPGTIKLQGPHIARVVKDPTVSPEQFCEYFNACLPSETRSYDPSETRAKGELRRETKTSEDRRGLTDGKSGTSREDAIKVVQLTDIHVERNYSVGSSTECGLPVCCLDKWGPGDAGPLGDFSCNIPASTIEIFLEKVKTFEPDIVFFSGDIPPHTVWDETPQSQLDCTVALVDLIARNLTGYNVYPIIGNHEGYPTNLFSAEHLEYTTPFVENWKRLWEPAANFSLNDVQESGSFSILLRPGLRLVTFNTNYMYTFNWYNVLNDRSNKEVDEMRDFVTRSLSDARAQNEKVLLIGHHPPGGADYLVTGSRWLEQLVLNYTDVIVLMSTGHTHTDEFRLIYDSLDEPQAIVYVSPSISANGKKNPSMRIYYLDPITFEVLDYDHYFLDLRPAIAYSLGNETDYTLPIELLYSAKAEYGLSDLSPQSWHDLTERFNTDDDLLNKHRHHGNADADSRPSLCNDHCKASHICRQRNAHYDEYLECVPSRVNDTSLWGFP